MKLAAWVAFMAALTPALAQQDGRRVTAPPDARTQLDMQHYYLPRELQVALSALETAYPEFLRLESLGRSVSGAELWVMTIARKEGLDPQKRPAALLVGGLGLEDMAAPEIALYTILDLVQNHERDDAVARVLDNATIYVVPCLNPDLRERVLAAADSGELGGTSLEEAVQLDRNFPVRWDPLRVERAGAYPLVRPEARVLAEFLIGRPNIAVVERFSASTTRSPAELGWPEADVRVHRRIAAEGLLESVETLPIRQGALLSFAYEQAGAFAFALPASARSSGEGVLPGVGDLLPLARNSAASTLRVLSSLPRLELLPSAPLALDATTWQVDVELRNVGRMPTCSALGAERFVCPPLALDVAGLQLVGAATLRASDGTVLPAQVSGASVVLPHIDAGSVLRVRLFVVGAAEATGTLTARAVRAGTASAELALR